MSQTHTALPGQGLRFLLVEDHEFQRRLLARLLATLGAAAVYEAAVGAAALEIAADPASALDIVISDLSMPGMNGLQLADALGATHPGLSLILCSALGPKMLETMRTMACASEVRLLGALAKPLTPASLAPLIAAHRQACGTAAAAAPAGA